MSFVFLNKEYSDGLQHTCCACYIQLDILFCVKLKVARHIAQAESDHKNSNLAICS